MQTNGNRFNGTTGDTAIFSLWNANATSGPSCGVFGGEGNGYSCRLAYPISTSTYYRYRVWRLGADSRADDLIARIREHVGIEEEFDVGPFRVVIPTHNVPPEALPADTASG